MAVCQWEANKKVNATAAHHFTNTELSQNLSSDIPLPHTVIKA